MKHTPIYPIAQALGAQFVTAAGWRVAQVFDTVVAEREAAIHGVALFDASADSRFVLEGGRAERVAAGLGAADLAVGEGVELEEGTAVFRLRRDQFFVAAPAVVAEALGERLALAVDESGEFVTLTDVTHGRAELRLIGPRSAALLSHLCGLDFHEREFPNMRAKQSSVAKTAQLVVRRDMAGSAAYSVIGGRSLAAYLWETMMVAGAELGVRPIGLAAVESL